MEDRHRTWRYDARSSSRGARAVSPVSEPELAFARLLLSASISASAMEALFFNVRVSRYVVAACGVLRQYTGRQRVLGGYGPRLQGRDPYFGPVR